VVELAYGVIMPAKTFTIVAGSKPAYEVKRSEDGFKVTIRQAGNSAEKVTFSSGMTRDLIRVLEELTRLAP